MFTQFDIIVSVITLFFVIVGFFSGAVKTVFSIGKWVGAWYITTRFQPQASEFVGQFMQPGTFSNGLAVSGVFIVSLITISLIGGVFSAAISGTLGGADKFLGIALGLVEGFLIASIIHYSIILVKGNEPDWLKEGQTYEATSKGADFFDKLLKNRVENIKVGYNDKVAELTKKISSPDKYDMGAVNSEVSSMLKEGKNQQEIQSKLVNQEFMNQFLKLADTMSGNINNANSSGSDNLMNNLMENVPKSGIDKGGLDLQKVE